MKPKVTKLCYKTINHKSSCLPQNYLNKYNFLSTMPSQGSWTPILPRTVAQKGKHSSALSVVSRKACLRNIDFGALDHMTSNHNLFCT